MTVGLRQTLASPEGLAERQTNTEKGCVNGLSEVYVFWNQQLLSHSMFQRKTPDGFILKE
jgi:hypothetical protein